MLGRRGKQAVLAEIPASQAPRSRTGAQGRAELEAFSRLARALEDSRAVCATGNARSRVAQGLATAAIATGRRVVLLECDLVTPALAGLLGLEPAPGLGEYLRGEAEARQILQALVLAGPASGRATEPLACIVAGEAGPSPTTLLASAEYRHVVEKLRSAYDLLVIAGPPLERDSGPLRAVADSAEATVVCGTRTDIPKKLPVPVAGLVILD